MPKTAATVNKTNVISIWDLPTDSNPIKSANSKKTKKKVSTSFSHFFYYLKYIGAEELSLCIYGPVLVGLPGLHFPILYCNATSLFCLSVPYVRCVLIWCMGFHPRLSLCRPSCKLAFSFSWVYFQSCFNLMVTVFSLNLHGRPHLQLISNLS